MNNAILTSRILYRSLLCPKLLNWPEYELSGPSLMRATAAYHHLIKPCNESHHGIPYSSASEPMIAPLLSNNAGLVV